MTRFYVDCEFIERGHQHPIDLISIGICCEDGREFYAVSTEFAPRNASQWVKDNVIDCLPPANINLSDPSISPRIKEESKAWKNRSQIKQDILEFVGSGRPEFWGEWSSYDHVVFCQIFGTMMDLPDGFPMRCRDIIQLAEDELGIPSDRLPPSLETEGNHNALLGARTVKMRYEWLMDQKPRNEW